MRSLRFMMIVCLAATAAGCAPDQLHTKPTTLLEDTRVNESSGIAVSRRDPNLIWMHNDSGDAPILYATNLRGENLGRFQVTGAEARDWEDLCAFVIDDQPTLVIADTGNNRRDRDVVPLYVTRDQPDNGKLQVERTIRIRFADGAQDCESVAFDPVSQSLYFISKHYGQLFERCRVYRLSWDASKKDTVHTLDPITKLPINMATAMDISRDGMRLAVLTYQTILLYERRDDEDWLDVFSNAPEKRSLPGVLQFEAIAFTADGDALLLTSENTPCPIWMIPLDLNPTETP